MEVTLLHKHRWQAAVKRGVMAEDYFSYCEEVGCDIWDRLLAMEGREGEPVCLWLPEKDIAPGTSKYVQGVELADSYAGPIPADFDRISFPAGDYLQFRGEPFEEETFAQAIERVWAAMEAFNPAELGCIWDDERPRIQLEPQCARGYIELRAIKKAQ